MFNTIKISIIFLALSMTVLMPKASYAREDQHSGDDGRTHHRHDFHFHENSDLTLVSGMDNIDSRVLVDPAVDPDPEVIYQPVPEIIAPVLSPSQIMSSDAEGNFIVNIPNNAGGFTPIRIQKYGNGYVGPQGEFYYPFPQVSQLKAMYGI